MLICIGGVCVPYTAVIPICILALKWFAAKLAQWGLLPKKLQELMHLPQATKEGENNTQEKSSIGLKNSGPSIVKTLESEEDFHKLVNGKNKVVCKFTATWCKPCHKIQPFYEQFSSQYASTGAAFLTIDVDDYDDIATKYKVAMMPTFIVVQGDAVLGTYAGSNEHQLQEFLKEHL